MNSHIVPLPKAPMTWRVLRRAILKGLCLYLMFNVVYGLINPVETGRLPTLYNGVFPGRVRFMKDDEFDAYRLIDSHVIVSARSDTFNIVILGSSEMWGTRSLADLSVPAILDRLNLVAADGRSVRVYNLGYPAPYGLKDLILMDVLFRREIPVDAVIWSTFDTTLSYEYRYHPVVASNFDLEMDVIGHYKLGSAYEFIDGSRMGQSLPVFMQLWEDRGALRGWLEMQTRGLAWSLTRQDTTKASDTDLTRIQRMTDFYNRQTLERIDPSNADFLYAFKQLSQERGIPVIILASPVPFKENEFAPWLQMQASVVGLPLIDCWNAFLEPASFEDYHHIRPEAHGPYAYLLITMLSDTRLMAEGPGLPLKRPPDFVPPSESCALYPAAAR